MGGRAGVLSVRGEHVKHCDDHGNDRQPEPPDSNALDRPDGRIDIPKTLQIGFQVAVASGALFRAKLISAAAPRAFCGLGHRHF